jgi:hypothetical protein
VHVEPLAKPYRRSMAMSAKAWLLGGMTTLQEVQKVLGTKFWTELAEDHVKAPGSLAFDAGAQGQNERRMLVLLLSASGRLQPLVDALSTD